MPDKKVLWMLNQLEGFEKPKIKLEQYATSSELAVSMMEMINELVGLDGVKLVDVGCGCGMLMTTAATLYEPESVLGIELDEDALKVCARNIEFADVQERCEVLQADVLDSETDLPRGTFDVAIINPPFGTKNNTGVDMKFVQVGLELIRTGGSVFSLHKSSTRDFILKTANKWENVKADCCAQMRWCLPATYKFHKQKAVDIDVDLIQFKKSGPTENKETTSSQ
ncbi:hypothetical protein GCK72_010023 [Caenorhabditis remanei]|uniref:Methyltransferase-like protein 5 n=1 Tax=Caenorhabditis remanei TaxID=31234 RepID=A0A6A5H3I9_CAERE|nr:hypothetical protein GCK72_010023 [Caenorhabditis remanei]KAF1761767.1 hypothetical protein GCK72_010023 [Caenorhabditis remanei]